MSDETPASEAGVTRLLANHAAATQAHLEKALPTQCQLERVPTRLREAIDYSLLAGGKRVRPALVLECCVATGGQTDRALPAAAAIELIHTFSLVHDDLPCMDDDDLRRGRPTSHKQFGEAMAVLAGDAMTTLAFEHLSAINPPDVAMKLVRELAVASGPLGMIGGQVLDIDSEGRQLDTAGLMQIHRLKTGALICCACRMGAIVAGASDAALDAVTAYGEHLGLAFQIADDVLDVTASTEDLGKTAGKDVVAGKNTYPALLGLEEAKRLAQEEADAAIGAVASLGEAADGLRALARFTVERGR